MALTARRVLAELVACGVTHIVWLPDSEAGEMYRAIVDTPQLTLVPVAREGETIAIAAGLWVGGAKPIVQMQSTGYYESGDSVRGLALDLGLPLLMMIGYRGWRDDGPLTDSAAVFLEPSLDTWGIPHHLVVDDAQVGRISAAYREAHQRGGPVAILIGVEYE
jgi:sulfopyruvate decarboxylase subunit alpha